MPTTIHSAALTGWEGNIVNVEAGIFRGLSEFSIVGLGGNLIQEAKKRIYSAIKNSSLRYPSAKKIINLSPANIKKQGTHFDLPIAVALLAASGQIPDFITKDAVFIGELGLNGQIKKLNGALALGEIAERNNFPLLFAPVLNKEELSLLKKINVVTVSSLAEVVAILTKKSPLKFIAKTELKLLDSGAGEETMSPFSQISGQVAGKRGCLIAAAGHHNLILIGSPGVGKTSLAECIPSLLPPLTEPELIDLIKIASICGKSFDPKSNHPRPLIKLRPNCTANMLLGNMATAKIGATVLANHGILFLDELLEFKPNILDLLKAPLDDQTISKMAPTMSSKFLLVAATNPCPCGLSLDPHQICKCMPLQIKRYRSRLSGALMDRIDLFVQMSHVKAEQIITERPDHTDWQQKIVWTRQKQLDRNQNVGKKLNNELSLTDLDKIGALSKAAKQTILLAHEKLKLSVRGFLKTQLIARTIADLEDENTVLEKHILEALNFRPKIADT